ncbi:MAG: hypothetical protein ACRCYX_11860 [Dermatophilaceae bacterium]
MRYQLTDPSGTTVIGGRLTTGFTASAPHIRSAQVHVPVFAEPPVVVATTAGRSGLGIDSSVGGNPGATVVVYDVNYVLAEPGHATLTFSANNTEPAERIRNGDGHDIDVDVDYIVIGRLASDPAA